MGRRLISARPSWKPGTMQRAGGQVKLHLQFERGLGCCAGCRHSPARPGQRIRQHNGGAIEQIDAGKALDEWDRHRMGRDDVGHCGLQHAPQELRCGLGKALIQSLGRNGDPNGAGHLGQLLERRLGIIQPAEQQGLDKAAPVNLEARWTKPVSRASWLAVVVTRCCKVMTHLCYCPHEETPEMKK